MIYFEHFLDESPSYEKYGDMHGYFSSRWHPEDECINVLVTMYDEDKDELIRTLKSIADMIPLCRRKVRVVVIQDGWCRAHPSIKQYFAMELFHDAIHIWNEIELATNLHHKRTYILQPEDDFTGELDATPICDRVYLFVTFIIKTDNRMKHNSHSWFFRAFCKEYSSTYLFLTDVGTTHYNECLSRMESFMDQNDGLVGCHGYPWIAELQKGSSWIQRYIRVMQAYELGPLATDHDRGFQSLFGFQQTLSGPCTFLRSEDALFPSLLNFMRSVLERDVSQLNILSSNLIIVEDTALTLYLFATSGKLLALVPDAYYYYDVETKPDRFFTQRRRWMNGVGCALLLFWKTYPKILSISEHGKVMQYYIRAILAVSICTQVIFPFLQPMLFAYTVFQSFNPNFCAAYAHSLRSFQEVALRPYSPWLSYFVCAFYCIWYLIWVLCHAHSNRAFHNNLFLATFCMAHVIGLYSYYSVLLITLDVVFALLPIWQRPMIAGLIVTHYVSPMIISIVKCDWNTLKTSSLHLIPYLIFFPMWSFMYGYNIARLWDVTWGNRVGVLDQQTSAYKRLSRNITYGHLFVTIAAVFGLCYGSLSYDASHFHTLYVAPWYLLSSVMGFMSIIWTVRYYIYQKGAIVSVIKIPTASNRVSSDSPRSPAVMKSSLSIFRKKTYSRLQRTFTFGVDKHTLIP